VASPRNAASRAATNAAAQRNAAVRERKSDRRGETGASFQMFSEAEAKRMMAESKSKLQQALEEVERYKAQKVRLEQQMEDAAVNVKRAEETVREAQQTIRSVHQVLKGHKATRKLQQEQSKHADEAMLVPEACFPPRPLSPSDEPARDEPRQPSAMNLSFQSKPIDKQPPLQLISTPALMASAPEPESESESFDSVFLSGEVIFLSNISRSFDLLAMRSTCSSNEKY